MYPLDGLYDLLSLFTNYIQLHWKLLAGLHDFNWHRKAILSMTRDSSSLPLVHTYCNNDNNMCHSVNESEVM